MIELFEKDKKDFNRKSSKGNQLKWETNNTWYKADYTGYEGLTEYVVSHLLENSSLGGEEFVLYEQEEIRYKSQTYMGVSCRDFLRKGEQLITLERLFQNVYGVGANNMINSTADHEDRLRLIVDKTKEITGLSDFGTYMAKLLAIDAFFLNEDRHTHNIAVIVDSDGKYRYCPIFDQGAGLLADTKMDYPIGADVYELMDNVQAKTFCQDFDEQLEIAEKLYGKAINYNFDKKEVDKILDNVYGYEKAIIDRVRDVIYEQMRKYKHLFR
jgi:hypothetical protein